MKSNFRRIYLTIVCLLAAFLFSSIPAPNIVLAEETNADLDAIYVTLSSDELHVSCQGQELPQSQWKDYAVSYFLAEPFGEEAEKQVQGYILELGEGTYVLSGELTGQVWVKAGKSSDATVVLDQFTAVNEVGPAFLCTKTRNLTIETTEGSENVLFSGMEKEINETCRPREDDSRAVGGALLSKADTLITGEGELNVYGYLNNGVHVTKNLTIDSGNLQIETVNNGIKVKDTFCGDGGVITIYAGNDGIKAAYEEEGEDSLGTLLINQGTITIECYDDGLQAQLDLQINGGMTTVTANGTYLTKGAYQKTKDQTFSGKGAKSEGTLEVEGGTLIVNAFNDGVHAAEPIQINDDILSIYCGDDGIHSDKEVLINGGTINISNSYEGIEANQLVINDGTISIFAWNDGMNANGDPGFGGSPGGRSGNRNSSATAAEMPNLTLNGGDIYVNSEGDGLDSNGNLTVTGGYIVVDGPASSMNGALDAGTENGGKITISGGLVWAGGTSAMSETFSPQSEQASFLAIVSSAYMANDEIVICLEDGTELFRHTPATSGTSMVFSCPELSVGDTCLVTINEDSYEVEMTGIATKVNLRKQR